MSLDEFLSYGCRQSGHRLSRRRRVGGLLSLSLSHRNSLQLACAFHFVIEQVKLTKTGTMKAMKAYTLGKIIVFGAVLPTVDTFADLILSGKLFVSGHTLWAIAILLPVLINFFFIVIAFRQFPFPPWHHRYVSVTMLVLQVEPQENYSSFLFLRFGPNISPFPLHMGSLWVTLTGLRRGLTT